MDLSASTWWWIITGVAVAAELATGTFVLLMLAIGLAAGAIAAHLGLGVTGQLVTAAVVGAAAVALHFRDPHSSGSWGICPLFAATGIYCPGCGGLRAVNDLTNADVVAAASSNLLFVASIPLLVFLPAGELVYDLKNGRLHSARFGTDRTIKNHQGENSTYRYVSSQTVQFVEK